MSFNAKKFIDNQTEVQTKTLRPSWAPKPGCFDLLGLTKEEVQVIFDMVSLVRGGDDTNFRIADNIFKKLYKFCNTSKADKVPADMVIDYNKRHLGFEDEGEWTGPTDVIFLRKPPY